MPVNSYSSSPEWWVPCCARILPSLHADFYLCLYFTLAALKNCTQRLAYLRTLNCWEEYLRRALLGACGEDTARHAGSFPLTSSAPASPDRQAGQAEDDPSEEAPLLLCHLTPSPASHLPRACTRLQTSSHYLPTTRQNNLFDWAGVLGISYHLHARTLAWWQAVSEQHFTTCHTTYLKTLMT